MALRRRNLPLVSSKDNLLVAKMDPNLRKQSMKVALNIVILIKRDLDYKQLNFAGPAEDYSKKAVKAVAKEEDSAKVKALKASAKGTKSIASFFAKKT